MFHQERSQQSSMAINTGGTVYHNFYFKKKVRIKRYWAVPQAAQAAHSTIVVSCTFTDKGTDGSGSTGLAILTNDSDLADSTTRKSSAWAAFDAKEVDCEDRPGSPGNTDNVADEIAAGTVISCAVLGAGSTPTANWFTVGIDYVESD